MTDELRRTPLYEEHLAAGAKMVPFAGFEMPIHYPTGITAEHAAVRSALGLFDVSHMGEFEIAGPEALELVQFVTSNDAAPLEPGQAQYSTLLRDDGGIVDDLLVYRFANRFMLVVNAANRARDLDWIQRHARRFDARVVDRSDRTALIAVQGPRSADVLSDLTDLALGGLDYYHFTEGSVAGRPTVVSRTGYTGEDGFEVYLAPDDAVHVWRALLDSGRDRGAVPVGLGARDTLRLEMGYALYGNDIDESRDPYEAGLGWTVKLGKGDFVARAALERSRVEGPRERLVGFRLLERGFPRPGYRLLRGEHAVGTVTSGTLGPSLGYGIGLGYVDAGSAAIGTNLDVEIRGRPVPAVIVRTPFYTAGSVRR